MPVKKAPFLIIGGIDCTVFREVLMEAMKMAVDIACVGFGPATAAFLHTLNKAIYDEEGNVVLESSAIPGMPLQVLCYERADSVGFGVSGVVSKAKAIRESLGEIEKLAIPLMHPITEERMVYLLDPHGASRRSPLLKFADKVLPRKNYAFRLPYTPPFLNKHGGVVFSFGQFTQWVSEQLMCDGRVQIWPASPVSAPLFEGDVVKGIKLTDQGVDKNENPDSAYTPGMEVEAALTVVGDGPVGQVGQALDDHFGLPDGHENQEWAVGMKGVVELPEGHGLKAGTVIHTFGYPEPEIFGFMYVLSEQTATLGIFVPSWLDNPVRTSYRYLQHWMTHPYLWQFLEGGRLRSWGAKTLQESGRRGEPFLVGDGYARIGEGSGTTNILTGSGVDEAWASGKFLAEGVIELLQQKLPFTKENLEKTYLAKRRASWLEKESVIAEKSRDGFREGFVRGVIGMGLTGITRGLLNVSGKSQKSYARIRSMEDYYKGILSAEEIDALRKEAKEQGIPLHDAVMTKIGWPKIEFDGKLLVSQQDALLLGGKVQAPAGYADHVKFINPDLCKRCKKRVCISLCSGQAITQGEDNGVPLFDREKCVHCGACLWNCSAAREGNPDRCNIDFKAGAGGLHSAEN